MPYDIIILAGQSNAEGNGLGLALVRRIVALHGGEIRARSKQGEFTDLCAGPHLDSTGRVKGNAIKLLSATGAYWRGDEKNKMLQRLYGIVGKDQAEIDAYLAKLEEAKRRDHRVLGRDLELFTITDSVGPGLAHWLPRGSRIRVAIEDYWRKRHYEAGYEIVYTPHVGKSNLWETSGHLSFYKEGMFPCMKVQEGSGNDSYIEEYYVKPMNCPFHIQIYQAKKRSYRDLPMRMAELGTVYRYEKDGVRHGLFRVRGFTQDDAHILCTPEQIVKEIKSRLNFLIRVGLDYLTLARSAGTLSGGESQRIRLATQIGSSLMGVLYILDEPSIGLHQRDNDKLLDTLKKLRDLGNTLIVVEHDEDTIRCADYIVDIGPGAGIHGGEVVCAGETIDIIACENSITGQYLSGKRKISVPENRRKGNGNILSIKGASENNLKNINVDIPLGCFTCVTGVSGSGKSSLINEILYKNLANELNNAKKPTGKFDEMLGLEHLDKVINIDQAPIGRTPRSNPATYTGVFTDIRELFASTQDAKIRGYNAGRFSFNVKGGRCEACEGDGIVKIEMHFLADVYVPCDVCHGARYNHETLEVKYKGKSIYDVLEMTVEEGLNFFDAMPKIKRKLQTLYDVGLGYIKLGQSSTTLSGGEAQRVKLATELSKRSTGKTVYILDEPTTGLHTHDVSRLLTILNRLTEGGNTVIVIEHNLDVIKVADHIIDLGPEGGDGGGTIIATGTPEEVAKVAESATGEYLNKILGN